MAAPATKAIRPLAICLVLVFMILFGSRLEAASVTLGWDANPETDITGYTLVYGTQSGVYTTTLNVGKVTSYTLTLNAAVYFFAVRAVNTGGVSSANSTELKVDLTAPPPPVNFLDADGKADLVVYRPSNGAWLSAKSASGYSSAAAGNIQWGNESLGDVPFMAEIDGDKITDLVVWRKSTGWWYWITSSTGYSYSYAGTRQWGSPTLGDVPMVGDIDGDGKSDLIVWRPTDGTWYWLTSSSGYAQASASGRQWGNKAYGDVPMLGDIDGDKKADLIVYRPTDGTWYWLTSSTGYALTGMGGKQWGNNALGDVPKLADMDGDGKSDLVVWRQSNGTWYWLKSSAGYNYANAVGMPWGNAAFGDVPLLGDIDGDGKADLVVWRKPSGTWYWLTSKNNYNVAWAAGAQWGAVNDIPMIR